MTSAISDASGGPFLLIRQQPPLKGAPHWQEGRQDRPASCPCTMIGQSEAPWVLPCSLHEPRSALRNTSGACSRGGVLRRGETSSFWELGYFFSSLKTRHMAPLPQPPASVLKTTPGIDQTTRGKCAWAAPNPIHEELSAAVLASRGMAARRLEFCCRVSTTNVRKSLFSS